MRAVIRRVVDLGVRPDQAPSERRRIRTVNVVATLAILFNIGYWIALAVIDAATFDVILATNLIAALLFAGVLLFNGSGRYLWALWTMFIAGPFNLIFVAEVIGFGTGAFLYLLVLPVTTILMAPPGQPTFQVGGVLMGTALFVFIAATQPETPQAIAGTAVETGLLVANTLGTAVFIAVVAIYFRRLADVAEGRLLVANERSETLLLNILPEPIAERLKEGEALIADRVDGATVLFADLVGSTPLSELLTADEMVELLNGIFTPFDDLADELGLEKIKTVGDAYMVVGGVPTPRSDHVAAVATMALAMRDELAGHVVEGFGPLQMRFGMHTGPVVAGVIGKRKFSYDLWGDTVNTASRMESHGIAGKIHVTAEVAHALGDTFQLTPRGEIEVKGKGVMSTFFLEPSRASAAAASRPG